MRPPLHGTKALLRDKVMLARVLRREPHSIAVSARSGLGIEELRALVDAELPRPDVPVDVVLPYDRGDLVSRIHRDGDVESVEHLAEGTRIIGRVGPSLAAELADYAVPA